MDGSLIVDPNSKPLYIPKGHFRVYECGVWWIEPKAKEYETLFRMESLPWFYKPIERIKFKSLSIFLMSLEHNFRILSSVKYVLGFLYIIPKFRIWIPNWNVTPRSIYKSYKYINKKVLSLIYINNENLIFLRKSIYETYKNKPISQNICIEPIYKSIYFNWPWLWPWRSNCMADSSFYF